MKSRKLKSINSKYEALIHIEKQYRIYTNAKKIGREKPLGVRKLEFSGTQNLRCFKIQIFQMHNNKLGIKSHLIKFIAIIDRDIKNRY